MKYKYILILLGLLPFLLATYFIITSQEAKASENQFYIKGGTGLNTINPLHIKDEEHKGKMKISHTFPLIEVGAGYKFADGIRIEGVFDYYFLFHSKEKTIDKFDNNFIIDNKTKAYTFFLNGYKDITNFGNFTPFIGGGIGISSLQEKATGYVISGINQQHYILDNVKSKKVNRMAYKLTLGVDYKISESFTGELSYNYFNLGYNKPKKLNGVDNVQRRRYGIHNILIGLRKSI